MFDSPATLLYRLQTVDQAIAQRRTRLKEISAAVGQSQAVQHTKKHVDAATAALKPWQARALNLDLEVKTLAGKMEATEESLYSGRISNPKAMQDMQNEIAALKRHQSKLEDDLLEAMVYSEQGQINLDAAQKLLNETQALHEGSKVDLLAEKERLESELPRLEAQRKEAANGIEPDVLAAYETLRPRKAGNTVALLQEASCTSCRIEQTSNLVQKANQNKTLVYCATCGSILAPRA